MIRKFTPIFLAFCWWTFADCAVRTSSLQSHPVRGGLELVLASNLHDPALVWSVREDGYVYAVGIGRFPPGSLNLAHGWAKAKRAAIDNAMMKLFAEVSKGGRSAGVEHGTNRGNEVLMVRGSVRQVEVVSVRRLSDGGCEVLIRAPHNQIFTTK